MYYVRGEVLYLLDQWEVVLVAIVVADCVHKVASWLESVENYGLFVAGGDEFVIAVSLDDGAEGTSGSRGGRLHQAPSAGAHHVVLSVLLHKHF